METLPGLALAVKVADINVQNAVPNGPKASEMITEGWKLRAALMPVVAGLASMGLIPQEVYDKIVRGSGVRDMAEDDVALSQVFHTYQAQIAGKHPADEATIARAEEVGSWLVQNLSKRTAKHSPDRPKTMDIRARLATLLTRRYSDLRAVAYYFYRDDFANYVPPLMSRNMVRTAEPKSEPQSEPTPEPTTTSEPTEKQI